MTTPSQPYGAARCEDLIRLLNLHTEWLRADYLVGETQGFTAELAGMLDQLVRQSISYDKIVDELITERDALRREANDLSTRIANVRKAIQPPG